MIILRRIRALLSLVSLLVVALHLAPLWLPPAGAQRVNALLRALPGPFGAMTFDRLEPGAIPAPGEPGAPAQDAMRSAQDELMRQLAQIREGLRNPQSPDQTGPAHSLGTGNDAEAAADSAGLRTDPTPTGRTLPQITAPPGSAWRGHTPATTGRKVIRVGD